MKSLAEKITELALLPPVIPNQWESRFIADMVSFLPPGQTSAMSPKQVDIVGRLHRKYCERAEA